jgi:hypothetical protein
MPTLTASVGKTGQNKIHDVAVVQAALKAIKGPKRTALYVGPVDGNYNGHRRELESAISDFQRQHKLTVTGRIDKSSQSVNRLEQAVPSRLKGLVGVPGSSLVAVRRFAGAGPADGGLKGLKLQADLVKVLGRLAQILDDKMGFDLAFTGRQVLVDGRILVAVEIAGLRFLDAQGQPMADSERVPGALVQVIKCLWQGSLRVQLHKTNRLDLVTNLYEDAIESTANRSEMSMTHTDVRFL